MVALGKLIISNVIWLDREAQQFVFLVYFLGTSCLLTWLGKQAGFMDSALAA